MTNKLDDETLKTVAERMLADYDAVNPGTIFAEGFRLELADAWRVQTAVTRLREARGERVIGYKVGAVSPGNQKMMGLPHPVWARLWNRELHETGVTLKKSDFANVSIEAEFGIVLRNDLTAPVSVENIAASVEAVYPLLELHNLVLRSEKPHGHELITNNCIISGVVRGAPVKDLKQPRETDLKLIYDGNTVDAWQSLRWPVDIVQAVVWLAQSLAEHDIQLKAGDLVLTSAWGPPVPIDKHTRVDVTSSSFGNVFANFV